MKTRYYSASSLDGFITDSKNSLDWLFQFGEVPEDTYPQFLSTVGAIAMGSTTYEWILDNHIKDNAPRPQNWMYEQPTWVFTSRQLPTVENADIRFVSGDVRPVHEQMSEVANGKDIWLVGGGNLAGQFHDCGLLDEIIVSIASVTLGGGVPLLPRVIVSPPLKLLSVRTCGSAFAELRYEVCK
jgi:dihydrofolate reductase